MIAKRIIEQIIAQLSVVIHAFYNAKETLWDSRYFSHTKAREYGLKYILAPVEKYPKTQKPF